jgi:tyrosinase
MLTLRVVLNTGESYCSGMPTTQGANSSRCRSPHGYGHNGIGGVMQDVWASPSDPIFWMHHAFVDRVYAAWQLRDPNRLINIDSGVDGSGRPLTLNYMISMGGIAPDVPIGADLNNLGGVNIGGTPFCYKYSY